MNTHLCKWVFIDMSGRGIMVGLPAGAKNFCLLHSVYRGFFRRGPWSWPPTFI